MSYQGCNQNTKHFTYIKGRQLKRAAISSIASLFKISTSLKGKNSLPEGANYSFREVNYSKGKQYLHLW